MSAATRGGRRPVGQAEEPRSYDRLLYPWVLITAAILILLAGGFAVWRVAFNTTTRPAGLFDTTSVFHPAAGFPDPGNPCMVVQKNLVATGDGDDRLAYEYLSEGLRSEVPFDRYEENNRGNRHLFERVRAYRFPSFEPDGTAASATGYIDYTTGGSAEVRAEMAWQDGRWKIARITVILQ